VPPGRSHRCGSKPSTCAGATASGAHQREARRLLEVAGDATGGSHPARAGPRTSLLERRLPQRLLDHLADEGDGLRERELVRGREADVDGGLAPVGHGVTPVRSTRGPASVIVTARTPPPTIVVPTAAVGGPSRLGSSARRSRSRTRSSDRRRCRSSTDISSVALAPRCGVEACAARPWARSSSCTDPGARRSGSSRRSRPWRFADVAKEVVAVQDRPGSRGERATSPVRRPAS